MMTMLSKQTRVISLSLSLSLPSPPPFFVGGWGGEQGGCVSGWVGCGGKAGGGGGGIKTNTACLHKRTLMTSCPAPSTYRSPAERGRERREAATRRPNADSPANMPDPEAFWLRPVMAITASMQPESGRIV